jgi:P27 family predicted phage terminase small subunit
MKEKAQEMFRQVAGFCLGMGTLAESDSQVIARYAIVWEKWLEAEINLAREGNCWVEVLAPDGSLRFCRPSKWQAQSNHCHEQLRQLETVLGLTPADRTRLGYGATKITTDPVDAMFDDVG